jgi:predicted NodU family carbamoyl transferase
MIIEDETSFMYKMLVQLKKLTGVGAVLTADFADQNNITVSTAPDALNCFDQSAIDAIWFPEVSKIKTKN